MRPLNSQSQGDRKNPRWGSRRLCSSFCQLDGTPSALIKNEEWATQPNGGLYEACYRRLVNGHGQRRLCKRGETRQAERRARGCDGSKLGRSSTGCVLAVCRDNFTHFILGTTKGLGTPLFHPVGHKTESQDG